MNYQELWDSKFLFKNAISSDICEMIAARMDYEDKRDVRARRIVDDIQITNEETVAFVNLFDSVHFDLTPAAEKFFKRKLIPTTNYCRIYAKGAELLPHDDSNHCECSMTVNIKNSPEEDIWPFYIIVHNKDNNGKYTRRHKAKFMMKQGDGVFYFGPDQVHWRDELEFDKCYQLFLHWVDENGKHAHIGRKKVYEEYKKNFR